MAFAEKTAKEMRDRSYEYMGNAVEQLGRHQSPPPYGYTKVEKGGPLILNKHAYIIEIIRDLYLGRDEEVEERMGSRRISIVLNEVKARSTFSEQHDSTR